MKNPACACHFFRTSVAINSGGVHHRLLQWSARKPLARSLFCEVTTVDTTINLQRYLDLLRDGDDCARTELLGHAYQRLRTVAGRMLRKFPYLRRREEADDVHHSALVRLHRALVAGVPESLGHFYNLATLQIRRELLDRRKQHARRRNSMHQEPPDPVDKKDEPRSMSDLAEFHRLVATLPVDERDVFNLVHVEGLTNAAAAEKLKISVRTVIRRSQKARISIHRKLYGEDNDNGRR
jgi:RNA polymerase sigma factor (sigma-70 family)